MTEDPPTPDRATILAWMAETGSGYKAASRKFGVPRSTIQSWAHAERDGSPIPAPRAPARARTRATPPPPPAVEPEEPWDPTTCDRETWLRRGMVRAMELSRSEHAGNHSGNAVRWETLAIKYRNELDELLDAKRLAGLAPAPVELPVMARETMELLPAYIRVLPPELAEPTAILVVQEMAKYKGGLWAEFAERLKGAR